MIWAVYIVAGWAVGAGLAWAFIAGASAPSPEPFRSLPDPADLARVA